MLEHEGIGDAAILGELTFQQDGMSAGPGGAQRLDDGLFAGGGERGDIIRAADREIRVGVPLSGVGEQMPVDPLQRHQHRARALRHERDEHRFVRRMTHPGAQEIGILITGTKDVGGQRIDGGERGVPVCMQRDAQARSALRGLCGNGICPGLDVNHV